MAKIISGQMDLGDRYKEVKDDEWRRPENSESGYCFVKGCGGHLFFHRKIWTHSILIPVKGSDRKMFEDGQNIDQSDEIFLIDYK